MRLSDAIAMGRVLLKPKAYVTIMDGEGCALGMAFAAIGVTSHKEAVKRCKTVPEWKWLGKTKPVLFPCYCNPAEDRILRYKDDYRGWIAHLFNEHVCGDKTWNLDQLIDWIRSVEPAEPSDSASQTSDAGSDMATASVFGEKFLDACVAQRAKVSV